MHAFQHVLGNLDTECVFFSVIRWNRLEILIPKHMWTSEISLQEQKYDKNQESTFFLETPCISKLGRKKPIYGNESLFFWVQLESF